MRMTLIIQGGTPRRVRTSHSNTRSKYLYAFARSMKQISSKVFLFDPISCSLQPRVEDERHTVFFGKNPRFLAEAAKSIGHGLEENLASMRYQDEAPVVVNLSPILPLVKTLMVASFHSCDTSLAIHTATVMLWKASKT